jgi:hypothetical protein
VLPGRVRRVSYEDVVQNLEVNVRRLLDFCGLEFEPACVDFHKTERSVHTPSSEQVRQPLFREGLLQWRHYEPWLRPLEEALGDALSDTENDGRRNSIATYRGTQRHATATGGSRAGERLDSPPGGDFTLD